MADRKVFNLTQQRKAAAGSASTKKQPKRSTKKQPKDDTPKDA